VRITAVLLKSFFVNKQGIWFVNIFHTWYDKIFSHNEHKFWQEMTPYKVF
jgi:hypothetical protein